jgi:hypothetical protein
MKTAPTGKQYTNNTIGDMTINDTGPKFTGDNVAWGFCGGAGAGNRTRV